MGESAVACKAVTNAWQSLFCKQILKFTNQHFVNDSSSYIHWKIINLLKIGGGSAMDLFCFFWPMISFPCVCKASISLLSSPLCSACIDSLNIEHE